MRCYKKKGGGELFIRVEILRRFSSFFSLFISCKYAGVGRFFLTRIKIPYAGRKPHLRKCGFRYTNLCSNNDFLKVIIGTLSIISKNDYLASSSLKIHVSRYKYERVNIELIYRYIKDSLAF